MNALRTNMAVCTVAAVTALAACGSSDDASTDSGKFPAGSKMASIAKAGKVKVGVQTTYPLIGVQTLNGYDGFDVRLAEAIAAKLGLKKEDVEFVPVTTPTREAFLQQGKVDFVAAAYTINDERDKVIDFAGPYLLSPSVLLVKAGNPLGVKSIEDMVGKKLCTATGGVQEAGIKKNFPAVAKSLTTFDSSAKCRDAVLNGQVDASTTELAILASFVSQNKGKLDVVNAPWLDSYYGIGVKQETDKGFCEWINTTLKELEDDGTWAKDYDATLGTVVGKAPTPPAIGSCTTPGPK